MAKEAAKDNGVHVLGISGVSPETCYENTPQDAERTMRIPTSVSVTEDVNPLARLADSYADDPFWDEFVQIMQEFRQPAESETPSAE